MKPLVESIALALRYQATREILALLAQGRTDREAGRRALLLAYLLDASLIGSQKELAKRMGLSQARVSQMLAVFKSDKAIAALINK